MKKLIIMSIISVLMACTTLNKDSRKNKVATMLKVEQTKDDLRQLNVIRVFSDSTEIVEEILFWPKGTIKFSATNGFEGEVAQMSWRRKYKRQVKLKEMQNETAIASQSLNLKEDTVQVAQTVLKKRKSTKLIGFGFGLVMVLVGLAYLFYQRKLFWKG